jgi:cytochrome c-type biogenesis protein CcmH/NrfG
MPDSPESRIARLEQRATDFDYDIRAFAPLVRSQAVLEEQMSRLREDQKEIVAAAKELTKAQADLAEQIRVREDREKRDRFIRITTLITLLLVFLSTTTAVIALVIH